MNLGTFVAMLLFFTGGAIAIVWSVALSVGYVRRVAAKTPLPGQLSAEEIDAMRARLDELEQRDLRVEELAERLDFVERALGRSRSGKALPNPSGE